MNDEGDSDEDEISPMSILEGKTGLFEIGLDEDGDEVSGRRAETGAVAGLGITTK